MARPERDGFYWYFPNDGDENELVDEETIVEVYNHADDGLIVSYNGQPIPLDKLTGEFSSRLTPEDARMLDGSRANAERLEREVEDLRSKVKELAEENVELAADLDHAQRQPDTNRDDQLFDRMLDH